MITLSPDFIKQINDILPADECDKFFDALNMPSTTSVRRNIAKAPQFTTQHESVKWCANGRYLQERIPFTFDPMFQAGLYYVQDASSMIIQQFVAQLTKGKNAVKYLDLCAAPGGKTTAAIDALPCGSLVVANEIMSNRAKILRENIIKWGNANCVVTNNDSAKVGKLTHFFDIIATDVPCSGEGMFRKDDEAVNQWNTGLVAQCSALQKEIIDNIWNALRPGGYMIYSTCTYNREEDEKMIDYIINNYDAESIDMQVPDEWGLHKGIDTPYHCYRFMPHVTKGEGLFISVIKKSDIEHTSPVKLKKKKGNNAKEIVPKEAKNYLPDTFTLTRTGDTIIAFPKDKSDDITILQDNLNIIYKGIELATIKGKDLIPTQCYALSNHYNDKLFNSATVDYPTAIAFLRGESITLPDTPRGLATIVYNGITLGFVKNLGNRANNLYPKEWRIHSSHLPDTVPGIF